MADLATLQVRIDANGAIRTTKDLGDALTKTGKAADMVSLAAGKTEAQIRRLQVAEAAAYREAERMASSQKTISQNIGSVATTARLATGAVTALVSGMAVRSFVQYADTMTLVNARLSLVTKSTGDLQYVQNALLESAQRTRTGLEETAGLYVRVARNADALGKSQHDLLRFTELVNMQLQIAGATTQEASSGVMQLGQALSKGKLDGDEFRTVLEAMPTVADALTKSLAGGVRAELFALAKQGKITATDIIDALLKTESETRVKFSQMPRTIAGAWIQSKNDILFAIGEINKATDSVANKTLQWLARFPGRVAEGWQIMIAPTPEQELDRLDRQITSLREVQNRVTQTSKTYKEAETKIVAAQTRINEIMEAARAQAKLNADATVTETQKVIDAEREAYNERYKAWQEDKLRADERKQWEEERIKRLERIAQAERIVAGRARMAAGVGLPTAGAVSATSVEDVMESARRAAAAEERAREIQRQQEAFQSRVRGARFGGVDPSRIRALPLPTPTPQEQDLLDEQQERIKMNEEIAKNFRDNMQRSLGDFFTSFIQTGRLSIQSLFQGLGGMGANMAGSGIAAVITGALPKAMGPFGSILAGLGLSGLGALFGRGRGATGPTAEERLAQAQGRYASIELLRQQRADEMRQFMEGRTGAAGRGVVQSVGTVLQETTASRMIGELVAIRVATRQTADAVRGGGSAVGSGTVVNVTVQGGAAATGQDIGEKVAEAVDRLLGTKVQTLRLTSGVAVVS